MLDTLKGSVPVRESLNVEFAVVLERREDLLLLLEDESIFHLDFQSDNDPDMAFREGIYGLLVGQKYRRPIRQTVLYTGPARMHMPTSLSLGKITVEYDLVDIREFDAEALLESGRPGDYALALLARGGDGKLREILERAGQLEGPQRGKALAQLVELSGLRRLEEEVRIEMKSMGYAKYIDDHVLLREIRDEALAKGEAKGRADLLLTLLGAKFGPLPKWARTRVEKAAPVQLEGWATMVLTAETLADVVGKR